MLFGAYSYFRPRLCLTRKTWLRTIHFYSISNDNTTITLLQEIKNNQFSSKYNLCSLKLHSLYYDQSVVVFRDSEILDNINIIK